MRLTHSYQLGRIKALQKVGLESPTAADEFVAKVDAAKDVPPTTPLDNDPSLSEGSDSIPLPQ